MARYGGVRCRCVQSVDVNLHDTHLGSLGIVEGVTCRAACRDILHVDVGDGHAVVAHEALTYIEHAAKLRNDGITGKYEVARRLAMTRRGIDIGRHSTARLLGDERDEVVVLAYRLGRCREVEQQLSTLHRLH